MINRTVRERVIAVMRTAGRPLSQAEVARLTGDLASSVRRTMQKMEREVVIRHKGYVAHKLSWPTFVLTEQALVETVDEMLDTLDTPTAEAS